jgi:hypothetical protein
MSYLFVDGAVAGAAGALVDPVVGVVLSPQPVTKAPITSPNSTIKVYVLFISGATFDEFSKKASSFFEGFYLRSPIPTFSPAVL